MSKVTDLKGRKPSARTRLSREKREYEIVMAARQIFESQGYESATVAEIAESIGVVEGTVLHYVKSKRGLMNRVIEMFYSEITEEMEEGISGVTGIRNQLRYVIHKHLSMLADNAQLCTVILTESRSNDDGLLEKVHNLNKRYTNIVIDIVKQGKSTGEIAEFVSPKLVRNMIFGSIEHYLWDYVGGKRKIDVNAVSDQLTRSIYSGIASHPDNFDEEINRLVVKLNTLLEKD